MAEAKQVNIHRDFVISGSLSAQAFRVGVRIDTTATRLIRLALNDFTRARGLEQEIVDALRLFDETMKSVRKEMSKANRRRREGVPSGMKQTYFVRTMVSAQAFKSAVMVDQIQRDLTLLSLAGNAQVADTAAKSQETVTEALKTLDSVVSYVSKALDTQNQRPNKSRAKAGKATENNPPSSGTGNTKKINIEKQLSTKAQDSGGTSKKAKVSTGSNNLNSKEPTNVGHDSPSNSNKVDPVQRETVDGKESQDHSVANEKNDSTTTA